MKSLFPAEEKPVTESVLSANHVSRDHRQAERLSGKIPLRLQSVYCLFSLRSYSRPARTNCSRSFREKGRESDTFSPNPFIISGPSHEKNGLFFGDLKAGGFSLERAPDREMGDPLNSFREPGHVYQDERMWSIWFPPRWNS